MKDQPSPVGQDWYSEKNLLRLWQGIREGEVLLCHPSDPYADDYDMPVRNKDANKARACTGMLHIIFNHVKEFEHLLLNVHNEDLAAAMKAYRDNHRHPMTERGILNWALMVNMGNTHFIKGIPLPLKLDSDEFEKLRNEF